MWTACAQLLFICLVSSAREFQLALRGDASSPPWLTGVLSLFHLAPVEQVLRTRTHAGGTRQQRAYAQPLPCFWPPERRKRGMVPWQRQKKLERGNFAACRRQ